ncbi:MAG: hypothetical protein J6K45_05905 [Clostridia bacterium]|nr:hypothetical protein [Clostridia bacterium]
MKFIKGALMGSMATATAMMLYQDISKKEKSKIMKKGKQLAKKVGVL